MASRTATTEKIGRVGQRRQIVIPHEIFDELRMREGDFVAITKKADTVVIKRKQVVDPDDTLTPEEWELVKKAEREMRQGKFVTLAQLKHALARKRPSRGRKTA